MSVEHFRATLSNEAPDRGTSPTLAALWWDAQGDWAKAHAEVDSLETQDGMAVHAYLHRKEGDNWNADYWYRRSGTKFRRPTLQEEWETLVHWILSQP